MRSCVVLPFPGNEACAASLARALGADLGALTLRAFPDGETLATVTAPCAGRDVVLVATLDRADAKTVPLVLAAGAARDGTAARVVLVAPYIAYMRQDVAFAPGQGVSARHYARLVSAHFDGLVTVDPHLHRLRSLDDVFTIPSRAVRSAPALAAWISAHVDRPVVVGPDAESEQWVADVATRAACPHVVLMKTRRGDRDVSVSPAGLDPAERRTPVLVDDIVSTGHTLVEAVRGLVAEGHAAPVCLAVHGVFADDAVAALRAAGAARVVTTNTIPNAVAEIDVTPLVAAAVADLLAEGGARAEHRAGR